MQGGGTNVQDCSVFGLEEPCRKEYFSLMFSHIVIFWTKPEVPGAEDAVLEGASRLAEIPEVQSLHAGRMVPSEREVVDQSYQVALNLTFATKEDEAAYQVHPIHVEFVEKVFKPNCLKAKIYDFE